MYKNRYDDDTVRKIHEIAVNTLGDSLAILWWVYKNPFLNGIAPYTMIGDGKEKKLLKMLQDALKRNQIKNKWESDEKGSLTRCHNVRRPGRSHISRSNTL